MLNQCVSELKITVTAWTAVSRFIQNIAFVSFIEGEKKVCTSVIKLSYLPCEFVKAVCVNGSDSENC